MVYSKDYFLLMKKLSSVSFYVPNFFHIIKSCFSLCVVPSFALVGIRPGIPLFKVKI